MSDEVKPRIEQVDNQWQVTLPGEEIPYRILSWRAPFLTLGHGHQVKTIFLATAGKQQWLGENGQSTLLESRRKQQSQASTAPGHDDLSSPMPGKVLEIFIAEGDRVKTGQRLMILEAMKMETPIRAPHESVVSKLHVAAGQSIDAGELLIELDTEESV